MRLLELNEIRIPTAFGFRHGAATVGVQAEDARNAGSGNVKKRGEGGSPGGYPPPRGESGKRGLETYPTPTRSSCFELLSPWI